MSLRGDVAPGKRIKAHEPLWLKEPPKGPKKESSHPQKLGITFGVG